MGKRPLSFEPTDNELDYIQDNNISWSAFAHKSLQKAMDGKKQDLKDKIESKLIIILIGIMCMIFTFVIADLFVLIITSICGVVAIFIGTFSILRLYKNER